MLCVTQSAADDFPTERSPDDSDPTADRKAGFCGAACYISGVRTFVLESQYPLTRFSVDLCIVGSTAVLQSTRI
jgi:hypothetical protein